MAVNNSDFSKKSRGVFKMYLRVAFYLNLLATPADLSGVRMSSPNAFSFLWGTHGKISWAQPIQSDQGLTSLNAYRVLTGYQQKTKICKHKCKEEKLLCPLSDA